MTALLSDETAAIALCAEGSVLTDAGDVHGALARYRDAVGKAPTLLTLHLILANAELLAGEVLAARATLRRALRVAERPAVSDEFALGKALVDAGAGADAVPCFRRVRTELPTDAAASAALAAALREAQRPEEGWAEVQHALRLAPKSAVAHLTAALILHDLADYAGALHCIERSLAERPESPGTIITRGYLRHLLGDHAGGWQDFEARALPDPGTQTPRWQGESLQGKTIAVLGEQGVGDQFQFLRFVRHPALQAARRVVVTCQPEAVALLRAAGYDAMARGTTVTTDFFVPLLSLPIQLGVDAAWRGTDGDSAYINLPDSPIRPGPTALRRVGLVWSGNPAHRNDAIRSIPTGLLHGLPHMHPSIRFVSMQHGVSPTDLPSGRWETNPQGDWLETARQLCTLDMLISVDTGIAHLAGALGVPLWILVSHVPDWRWGPVGNTSPWYPSARIFRQPTRGDWTRVLTNVSAALSASVAACEDDDAVA
jgi:hypothetical protein